MSLGHKDLEGREGIKPGYYSFKSYALPTIITFMFEPVKLETLYKTPPFRHFVSLLGIAPKVTWITMAGATGTGSGAENLLAFLSNPSLAVLAKFGIGRSSLIRTGRIDECRGFYRVTKGAGQRSQNLGGLVMSRRPRKEEAGPEVR